MKILSEAEQRLGKMNPTKRLYRPEFGDGGPYVINTPNFDGGFARLSLNAAGYWPALVWELSHETVHLLDPDVAGATYLEEGLCDLFAIEMAAQVNGVPSTRSQPYIEAEQLVKLAFPDPYEAGKQIRTHFGRLRDATVEGLQSLFPNTSDDLITLLLQKHPGP